MLKTTLNKHQKTDKTFLVPVNCFIPMHTDQLSTTVLVNLSENISRTNSFRFLGIDFYSILKYQINCVEYIFATLRNRFLDVSFKVYLVSVSSATVIFLQCSHVNLIYLLIR